MIQAWLFDIEGTTTDIAFVHQVLFPYALARLSQFVAQHGSDPDVQDAMGQVAQTLVAEGTPQPTEADCIAALCNWIQTDRKHTALKVIQGLIWKTGYTQGDYVGHVYPDVLPALQRLKAQGATLGIYSSGSVAAQKLLFGYSSAGDLTPWLSHYFDTRVGAKREPGSYQAILEALQLPGNAVAFCSDIPEELAAAQAVGIHGVLVARGTVPAQADYPVITSFDSLADLFSLAQ